MILLKTQARASRRQSLAGCESSRDGSIFAWSTFNSRLSQKQKIANKDPKDQKKHPFFQFRVQTQKHPFFDFEYKLMKTTLFSKSRTFHVREHAQKKTLFYAKFGTIMRTRSQYRVTTPGRTCGEVKRNETKRREKKVGEEHRKLRYMRKSIEKDANVHYHRNGVRIRYITNTALELIKFKADIERSLYRECGNVPWVSQLVPTYPSGQEHENPKPDWNSEQVPPFRQGKDEQANTEWKELMNVEWGHVVKWNEMKRNGGRKKVGGEQRKLRYENKHIEKDANVHYHRNLFRIRLKN